MLKGDVYFGALITPGVLVADLFFFRWLSYSTFVLSGGKLRTPGKKMVVTGNVDG